MPFVNFTHTQSNGSWSYMDEFNVVPRVGETVSTKFHEGNFKVSHVHWTETEFGELTARVTLKKSRRWR